MVTARDVSGLLEDRPELEPAVEAVLAADEPFGFDELDIDSGQFGELVAADLVEKTDAGYRVADRQAVEQGLAGEGTDTTERASGFNIELDIDRRAAVALAGALGFVFVMRTVFSIESVFRDGAVVLSGNDPYYYRYWVEQLLADPELTLSSLPGAVTKGEPLYVATLWAIAAAFGGGQTVTGWVLAWYPVVSAVGSGVLVYVLTVAVTDDRRVGLAAVVMLGVVAGHGLRTSLGFADHHAFDYPWLGLTALALVGLVRNDLRSWRTALATLGLAVGVAGQVLAWEAGPLLIVPVGVTIAVLAVVWVRAGASPLRQGAPVLIGLGGAAVLVWLGHTSLGWHTTVVASAPALLVAGSGGVLVVSELIARVRPDARLATGAMGVSGLASSAGVAVLLPEAWAPLTRRVSRTLIRTDAIAETDGLFADSAGWLLLFGFVLVLAVPYLLWGTRRALEDDRWVVPVVYAWAFFGLAVLQIRFVGEFASFAALFAGLGFLHLAERVDIARLPSPFANEVDGSVLEIPNRRQASALIVLFLLIGGLGLVQVPIKTNQVTTPPSMYDTAAWMDNYTEAATWGDRPEYVFSQWGDNRMYNYHVSGESRSYGYARSNYEQFLASPNETMWYNRLQNRAGFVVYSGINGPPGSVAERLDAYGSRTVNTSGLAHYRAVYVSPNEKYRVFTLVPGATLAGTADSNTTVGVATTVEVRGETISYERQVRTDANGTYSVTVAYPGQYQVANATVDVSEAAVLNGTRVAV